jgi:3-deoxy-D-manno-octulosonic-acid transferase
MARLLDALYLFVLLLLGPWLVYRAWRTGRYRRGLRHKLRGLEMDVPTGAVWFHAVSLGEVHVLRQLVPAFRQRHPDRPCVVSATTDTGMEEARKLFPDLVVFPFPFDFSWACRRTLDRVRPSVIVLTESELWPNFLGEVRRRHIPIALVNGRMSPRSLARYHRLSPLVRRMFAGLNLVAVQTNEYAAAMLTLGATPGQVVVTGNLKYDGAMTDRANPKSRDLAALLSLSSDDLVWIAGSTCEPEEQTVLDIYRCAVAVHPRLRLVLVPRQPDRFDEVARLLEKLTIPFARRSALSSPLEVREGEPAPVVLVDTIGELNALYALASVAFVGGSLDGKRGGQNMIEPAAYGAAVVFGPHVWNFKDPASRLLAVGGACQATNKAELAEIVLRLLADPDERHVIGKLARAFVLSQQGATQRTLDRLDRLLPALRDGQAA